MLSYENLGQYFGLVHSTAAQNAKTTITTISGKDVGMYWHHSTWGPWMGSLLWKVQHIICNLYKLKDMQ